jgi:hypothetical protein
MPTVASASRCYFRFRMTLHLLPLGIVYRSALVTIFDQRIRSFNPSKLLRSALVTFQPGLKVRFLLRCRSLDPIPTKSPMMFVSTATVQVRSNGVAKPAPTNLLLISTVDIYKTVNLVAEFVRLLAPAATFLLLRPI